MKRFLLLTLLLGYVTFAYSYTHKISKSDTVTLEQLKTINLHKYIGKEVGLLICDKLLSRYKDRIFTDEPPGVLQYLILQYSKTVYLELYVENYSHLKQFDIKRKWSLDLYKKEKLTAIRVMVNYAAVKIIR